MNPVSRGIRNAFRNGVRTASIVLILGLSIGLSLTMLIAQKAVDNKIASVKRNIGNTVTISPAGFNPSASTNNALTTSQLAKVKSLAHVNSVDEILTGRESTTGSTSFGGGRDFGADEGQTTTYTTNLTSPVTLNANGPRFSQDSSASGSSVATTFSLPISFLGTTNPSRIDGSTIAVTSGKTIDGSADTSDVLISEEMASKNNLSVGSTFSAYNTTLTVAGIFNANTQGTQGTVVLSLPTLQRLSGQTDIVSSAVANVDSLDNLSSVTSAIKATLGTSNADVTSSVDQANQTVEPLNSVKHVTTFSLIGAVIAGAVIILLVMVMIVRERKKEIGVAKAIGGSNLRIMSEFMVEALTLAVLGAVIGLLIGVVGGQPVTKQLVSSSTSTTNATQTNRFGGMGMPNTVQSEVANNRPGMVGRGFRDGLRRNGTIRSFSNIKAEIGPSILLEGFAAAVLIAVIGSALSAAMIAKVRPSTIMRAE